MKKHATKPLARLSAFGVLLLLPLALKADVAPDPWETPPLVTPKPSPLPSPPLVTPTVPPFPAPPPLPGRVPLKTPPGATAQTNKTSPQVTPTQGDENKTPLFVAGIIAFAVVVVSLLALRAIRKKA